MEKLHVTVSAEKLGYLFGIPITNTVLMSWVVVLVIITLSFVLRKKLSLIPGKFQLIMETMVSGAYDFVNSNLENEKLARQVTPFLLALFSFILLGNWLEFIPGVESIIYEHAGTAHPVLRGMNTDLNVTLALAIIAFVTIEVAGIMTLGFFKYSSKFINFHSPVGFFVGLLELLSECVRLVSFSFRLFGNIFAGSVLVMVLTFLAPYIIPVPFMIFEVGVGVIQAAVFSLLTLFFIKLAIMEPSH
jgi:F-type H+-transporting ATPase subunit a